MYSQKEIAELSKSRALNDAELIKGGAEYKVGDDSQAELQVTDRQREDASKETDVSLSINETEAQDSSASREKAGRERQDVYEHFGYEKLEARDGKEIVYIVRSEILGGVEVRALSNVGKSNAANYTSYWDVVIVAMPEFMSDFADSSEVELLRGGVVNQLRASGDGPQRREGMSLEMCANLWSSFSKESLVHTILRAINGLEMQYKMLVCWQANAPKSASDFLKGSFGSVTGRGQEAAREEWKRIKELPLRATVVPS